MPLVRIRLEGDHDRSWCSRGGRDATGYRNAMETATRVDATEGAGRPPLPLAGRRELGRRVRCWCRGSPARCDTDGGGRRLFTNRLQNLGWLNPRRPSEVEERGFAASGSWRRRRRSDQDCRRTFFNGLDTNACSEPPTESRRRSGPPEPGSGCSCVRTPASENTWIWLPITLREREGRRVHGSNLLTRAAHAEDADLRVAGREEDAHVQRPQGGDDQRRERQYERGAQ